MNRYDATNCVMLNARQGENSMEIELPVEDLVLGGWTGRRTEDIQSHINELEALGVPGPREVPVFYHVASSLLTTAPSIQVTGEETTGEVEFMLLRDRDSCWVGVGSDHTDRKVELIDITLAKQVCAKPIAPEVWELREVEAHWDALILRSWVHTGQNRKLYQESSVSAVSSPRELIRSFEDRHAGGFRPGTVLFSGTFALASSFEPAARFSFEMEDPVLGRRISHEYGVRVLCR
jgi:Protein of unknown function (DUF2848)